MSTIGILDLFAGPGGLGEGFASLESLDQHPFRIMISVEKERSAHATLRLRAFLREVVRNTGRLPKEYIEFHAGLRAEPDWASVDAAAWRHAQSEARCLELGTQETAQVIDDAIEEIAPTHDKTILIGGPPCQAYSLVGRSRAKGIRGYRPQDDHRHYLFREYIRVLEKLRPAAFVMENVKGVLSSRVEGRYIFEEILSDLCSLGGADEQAYELMALHLDDGQLRLEPAKSPADFIVRAEEHGVPQRRHRVIIVGIRSDHVERALKVSVEIPTGHVSVNEAIGELPPLRSGLSRSEDKPDKWRKAVEDAADELRCLHENSGEMKLAAAFATVKEALEDDAPQVRRSKRLPRRYGRSNDPLRQWIERPALRALAQHETRGHMASDLARYIFASTFGRVKGRSAKKDDYPSALAPNHRSWDRGVFSDRFRAQLAGEPSTTIVSHIAKDGHHFIHPDPLQCRSLTVREAARLQTFPDDYLFLGNRTQQYVQVGNAVPPYLARQIASLLLKVLGESTVASLSAASGSRNDVEVSVTV